MSQIPTITVQLVHTSGPLKGQTQEFSQFPVTIGRDTGCQVRFDKTMTTISRHHARIECQGNRFRIIDTSTNGTYVNGKRIADVYLRDGDLITFSPDGPKASFLAHVDSDRLSRKGFGHGESVPVPSDAGMTMGPALEVPVVDTEKPLMIQYGEQLKTFALLPITVGSGAASDFVIADHDLAGCHIQFFFWNEDYYVRDLTGKEMVTINGRPVGEQSVLATGAELSLSAAGPRFRFLSGGKLAQIIDR